MGDMPPEGSETNDSVGDEGLDQADLDALFAAASGDAPPEGEAADSAESAPVDSSDTAEQGGSGSFDQAEIDALMGGGGGDVVDDSVTATAEEDPSGSFDQAAIDALMGGGGDADPSKEAVAEESAPDERLDSLGRPFDEAAAMMQAAIDEERAAAEAAKSEPTPLPVGAEPADLPSFDEPETVTLDTKRITMLNDVNLRVKVQLGKTKMLVEDILQLGDGSVVELDKLAGDPVDVLVNDRIVARGEVLVLNDNFCVRVSEVIDNDPHRVTV